MDLLKLGCCFFIPDGLPFPTPYSIRETIVSWEFFVAQLPRLAFDKVAYPFI